MKRQKRVIPVLKSGDFQELHGGKPVQIYFNLHKKCYSVRCMKTRLVLAHLAQDSNILLQDVKYKVSEAGRQRVLREGRKNVHAFVQGIIAPYIGYKMEMIQAEYNPKKAATFTQYETGKPILTSECVLLAQRSTDKAPLIFAFNARYLNDEVLVDNRK